MSNKIQKLKDLIRRELSPDQQRVVNAEGKNVVIAGPGSGKTRTMAYRLAKLLIEKQDSDSGVVASSFTNTAVQEIQIQLDSLGICLPLSDPNFLGTIDSFLMQKIFIRYAHRVMGCPDTPQLVFQEQYKTLDEFLPEKKRFFPLGRNKRPKTIQIGKINYLASGKLDFSDLLKDVPYWARKDYDFQDIYKAKAEYARVGLATHSDVIYWCTQILQKDDWLMRNFQAKYRYWILDEAQDTSLLHENLLKLLWSDNTDVLIVGDPDQAIFEWNQATPEFLINLTKRKDWTTLQITENWRSSQKICDATHYFRSPALSAVHSTATGAYKNIDINPYLLLYNPNSIELLPAKFEKIWNDTIGKPLPNQDVAIVTWRHSLISQIRHSFEYSDCVTGLASDLIDAVTTYTESRERGFRVFEKMMSQILFNRPSVTSIDLRKINFDLGEWNRWLSLLLFHLNNKYSMVPLDYFLQQARNDIEKEIVKIGLDIKLGKRVKFVTKPDNLPSMDQIAQQKIIGNTSIPVRTIHKVKGMTLAGVMLIGTDDEANQWLHGIDSNTKLSTEQRRMAYVALTRPQKLMIIAIPTTSDKAILSHSIWSQGKFQVLSA